MGDLVDHDGTIGTRKGVNMDVKFHGADFLEGGAGMDVLYGDGGNDTLIGGVEGDTLIGGAGDDTYVFHKGDGVDVLEDVQGINKLVFSGGTVEIQENASTVNLLYGEGDVVVMDKATFTTMRIEGATLKDAGQAKEGDDQILGSTANDVLQGGAGDDLLQGGEGNDVLQGGTGYDVLTGGKGNDQLAGGADNDAYVFQSGDGVDSLEDEAGSNQLVFAGETITLTEETTIINLWGIVFIDSTISLSYGAGDMVVMDRATFTTMNIQGATIVDARATAGNNHLTSSMGNEVLQGAAGNDTYYFYVGAGNDVVEDVQGDNILSLSASQVELHLYQENNEQWVNLVHSGGIIKMKADTFARIVKIKNHSGADVAVTIVGSDNNDALEVNLGVGVSIDAGTGDDVLQGEQVMTRF